MIGASDFKFECVELLDYKLHKIKLKRGGSYIKSPRNKLATINPKNEDDIIFNYLELSWVLSWIITNYLEYAITIALNHQNIGNRPEIISNIKPFIGQYNWRDTDFSAHQNRQEGNENLKDIMAIDWNKFEENNKTIVLNILHVPHNKKEICVTCRSKYNRKRENQVVLLMITNGEKYHYVALNSIPIDDGYNRSMRSLSRLFRGITSNHNGDF